MKLIAKKDFAWAHGGSDVRQYAQGQRIESDDADMIRVALDEGWADLGEWEDPIVVREPTKEELLGMRDALAHRERELQDLAARLDQQALDNQAEAERLADALVQLTADRAALDAVKAKPATSKNK